CALALLVCCGLADNAAAQTCPAARWQRVPPSAAGWSLKRLRDADAIAQQLGTDSYVVVQGGRIVWEFGSTSFPSNVHSVRKSIASVLFGIAHDQREVDLGRNLAQLGIDDVNDGLSPVEKAATVRDLLSARSCIYHKAAYETQGMQQKRPERHSCRP